jgi:hypothetical protein
VEHIRIGERDALGHPRSARESPNIDATPIDGILANDVLLGREGERDTAAQHRFRVPGVLRSDENHPVTIQLQSPTERKMDVVRWGNPHEQCKAG